MKTIIYSHWTLHTPHIGAITDMAIKECNDLQNEVLWISCDHKIGLCITNPTGSYAMCKLCQFTDKCARNLLPKNHTHAHISQYLTKADIDFADQLSFDYQTPTDIKTIKWKQLEIGYGALSTYISTTRNLNPKIDATFRHYFDSLLQSEVKVITAFEKIIDEFKPDRIYLFNGRTVNCRPVFELAKARQVEVICMEIAAPKNPFQFQLTKFINALPHDIAYNEQLIEQMWNQYSTNPEDREAVARRFFENRRNAQRAGDKIYIAHQQTGLMPDNWNPELDNIVIFNSSEDEFFAIGGAWEEGKIFESQMDGIKAIVEHYATDISKHFYLKVHPNLIPIKYKYHTDLYKLSYPNLTIIKADSPVSSYAMMDAADKVIVFGSSTGIEASYAKKPVIQLRAALYNFVDSVYVVHNTDELWQLIDTKDLPSKYNDRILKIGFYYATDSRQTSSIDINMRRFKLFGRYAIISKFLKIWGSSWLFVIISRIYKNLLLRLAPKSRFKSVPTDEA